MGLGDWYTERAWARSLGWLAPFAVLAALGCSGDQTGDERDHEASSSPPPAETAGKASAGEGGSGSFGEQPTSRAGAVSMPPAAGKGGSKADDCAAITQMAEASKSPVDIVWIVDGSPSMVDEIAAVTDNITNFANQISGAGIDHHVVMLASGDIAAGTPLGMDAEHYLYVPALVGSNDALQQLIDLYPNYSMFLRPNSALSFVVVTDDDSFLSSDDFKSQMEMLAGKKFQFHAIASESVNGAPCVGACGVPLVCGGFAPGVQYYALADSTGGQKISICTEDWSMVFAPLQAAVIASAPLPCDYPIPAPPDGQVLDSEKVNLAFLPAGASDQQVFPHAAAADQCADNLAWFYDDPQRPTVIKMCPSACTAIGAGGTVQIELGCKTIPLDVM
jgi:hypothetical protein